MGLGRDARAGKRKGTAAQTQAIHSEGLGAREQYVVLRYGLKTQQLSTGMPPIPIVVRTTLWFWGNLGDQHSIESAGLCYRGKEDW